MSHINSNRGVQVWLQHISKTKPALLNYTVQNQKPELTSVRIAMSISHTAVRTRKPESFYRMAESTFRNMHFTSFRQKGAISLCLFCSRWHIGFISHYLWPRNFGEQVSESRRVIRLHQAPGCYLELVCLEKDTALKCGLEVLSSHLLMSYWWYLHYHHYVPSPTSSLRWIFNFLQAEGNLNKESSSQAAAEV